jgi:hypothetical protein
MNTLFGILNWTMLILSILGFAKLLYDERWGRAAIASVLTGISLYMMLFF